MVVALILTGCSSGSGGTKTSEARGSGNSNTPAGGPCAPRASEKPAKALLRCGQRSIALVETDYATGTGVVVRIKGATYVLTNDHVVDPFRSADVTINGTTTDALPFVGSDVAADVALLGPLTKGADPLPIGRGNEVRKGDDVFAIGYPGENPENDVELTVASGIVSRIRTVDDFDQTYIQTDAKVAAGQSGGPLFDAMGRMLGITGLSYEGDFGLALAGSDVLAAAERIAAGKGDTTPTVPASADPLGGDEPTGGALTGSTRLSDPGDGATLFLPPSSAARNWTLTVPDAAGQIVVDVVESTNGDPLASSASNRRVATEVVNLVSARTKVDPATLQAQVDQQLGLVDPALATRETAPGTFTIALKADQGAEINLAAPLTAAPVAVAWASDQPLWPLSSPLGSTRLTVGEEASGVLGGYDSGHELVVDLAANQEVQLWARSPQGDVSLLVVPPGAALDAVAAFNPDVAGFKAFEDSQVGLYGFDVRERFTAGVAGTYRFRLATSDGSPVAWKFTVSDCAVKDACFEKA